MTKFGLIGATALSLTLALAGPAMARDVHHAKSPTHPAPARVAAANGYAASEPNLPIENALRWGYSQGYSNYPSGYGGLYGDGRYPGNTISNRNYPTWW
jgi:hypothetical protein